ncbi:MAG: SCP2 sterol-binding domain-containing protein [Desulfomonilia bacterium]|jgi:putative sterol carrier protein
MAGKVAYLSREWRDEVERRLKKELSPEKMKFLTTSVAFNYTDCPDGKDRYLYLKTENGVFTDVTVDEGSSQGAEFVITGSYDLFSRVTQGLVSSQRALMSGKLKLKGNMVRALKLASLSDRMNKIMSQIPTEY